MDALDIAYSRTFTDMTGNGHDAIYNQNMTLSDDDPFDLAGSKSVIHGNALAWYMGTLDNPETMDLTSDGSAETFTLECWYKPTTFDPEGDSRLINIMNDSPTKVMMLGGAG